MMYLFYFFELEMILKLFKTEAYAVVKSRKLFLHTISGKVVVNANGFLNILRIKTFGRHDEATSGAKFKMI